MHACMHMYVLEVRGRKDKVYVGDDGRSVRVENDNFGSAGAIMQWRSLDTGKIN